MKTHHRIRRAELLPATVPDITEEALPPQAGSPPVDRAAQIREAAYFLYEARGCAPGHELEDWLAAEGAVEQASGERTAAESAV